MWRPHTCLVMVLIHGCGSCWLGVHILLAVPTHLLLRGSDFLPQLQYLFQIAVVPIQLAGRTLLVVMLVRLFRRGLI